MGRMERYFDRLGEALAIFVGVGGLVYEILFAYIVADAPTGVLRAWLVLAILEGLAVTGVFVALLRAPAEHRSSRAVTPKLG